MNTQYKNRDKPEIEVSEMEVFKYVHEIHMTDTAYESLFHGIPLNNLHLFCLQWSDLGGQDFCIHSHRN